MCVLVECVVVFGVVMCYDMCVVVLIVDDGGVVCGVVLCVYGDMVFVCVCCVVILCVGGFVMNCDMVCWYVL